MSEESEHTLQENDVVLVYSDELKQEVDAVVLGFRKSNKEAYIHYIKQDKRLDHWIDVSKLKYNPDGQGKLEEHILSRFQRNQIEDSDSEDELQTKEYILFEKLHGEVTKIRNIDTITLGKYTIKTWYFSPYPHPFYNMDHFYICEHCFSYFATKEQLDKHIQETNEKTPPGKEIYREGNISIYELKGWRQKIPCQCLCLLSKLFLDHKTLTYDVDGFVFYVLCECDDDGAHVAAYYSRETASQNNILACITTLPPYQKKGYGRILISLSYEIAKRQFKVGGPERPLSDLGRKAYRAYWHDTILETLRDHRDEIKSVENLSTLTSIQNDDVIIALKQIGLAVKVKGEYELNITRNALNNALKNFDASKCRNKINPQFLIWLPGDDDQH
ncbi:MOZ/SAS family protein [Trichomonas vaginalis G3]|uniref:Histone acetyltransferase n=1 Tax=Trichomonas vaginalis (strain ATCC PRA-98 / G3) TaxID=412133 RepID=A2EPN6_TRIV3|nr:histone acetyltransferase protein [Trichomonas vaginalis G3]EAY05379.1 MOZ/SAS family protein [Trichomonas vaginalis G3]KAI5524065.1 histone acetyltransferase protein [Trichomonas vaginalis G3]|eukprot:XP_001317602.1 MOZ/SAS family protein [Trichomonas vaginalis G3]